MNEEYKILAYLTQQIEERKLGLSESLGSGSAQDYPAYREVCGQIRGLLFAQSIINDLEQRLEKFIDD
jgi:hypothetical protein